MHDINYFNIFKIQNFKLFLQYNKIYGKIKQKFLLQIKFRTGIIALEQGLLPLNKIKRYCNSFKEDLYVQVQSRYVCGYSYRRQI